MIRYLVPERLEMFGKMFVNMKYRVEWVKWISCDTPLARIEA